MTSAAPPTLMVIARAPFHVFYEGKAQAVTATNSVGEFDVLPGHADLFSVLRPCDVVIETTEEPVAFHLNSGILTVRDDEVFIFVDV